MRPILEKAIRIQGDAVVVPSLPTSPFAIWTMDNADTDGTTIDDVSGNNNDLYCSFNSVTELSGGRIGESIQYVADTLIRPSELLNPVSAPWRPLSFCFSIIFRNDVVSVGDEMLAAIWSDDSDPAGWFLRLRADGTLQYTTHPVGAGAATSLITTETFDDDGWHIAIVGFNNANNEMYLYTDLEKLSTTATNPIGYNNAQTLFMIGAIRNDNLDTPFDWYTGRQDETVFYDRFLTTTEADQILDYYGFLIAPQVVSINPQAIYETFEVSQPLTEVLTCNVSGGAGPFLYLWEFVQQTALEFTGPVDSSQQAVTVTGQQSSGTTYDQIRCRVQDTGNSNLEVISTVIIQVTWSDPGGGGGNPYEPPYIEEEF